MCKGKGPILLILRDFWRFKWGGQPYLRDFWSFGELSRGRGKAWRVRGNAPGWREGYPPFSISQVMAILRPFQSARYAQVVFERAPPMMLTREQIKSAALRLEPTEREALAEELLLRTGE